MPERYLITAALPYVNNVPHIGNIVGSHLPADIFARYCRLKGRETLFIGGTDEHGSPSEIAAQKAGIPVQELCDTFYDIHLRIYKWFGFSYDNFSRTSRQVHHEITREFFLELRKNGFISEQKMKMPFCEKDSRFLADRFVEGKCPKCANKAARGDQCEQCGSLLTPSELIDPYCVLCKSEPVTKETTHLFLNLDKLQPKLEEWANSKGNWKPQVRNLALAWLKEGLRKRAITRDLKWGVKVPVEGYGGKVLYVWFDAPIGYISSTKEWIEGNSHLEKKDYELKKWWVDRNTKLFHFIGKDNIPFHTIFFPAMLIGEGRYNLPHQVAGYQYLNYEGGKISKSKGHGIFCETFIEEARDALPADVWRFYLALKLPEIRDTEFTWSEFESRVNTELMGNLSNFVNRVTTFIEGKKAGKIAKPGKLSEEDLNMLKEIKAAVEKVDKLYDDIEIVSALQSILELSAKGNQYFQGNEPWKRIDRQDAVLWVCANICKALGVMLFPIIPEASGKLRKILGLGGVYSWNDALKLLPEEHMIGKSEILFHKLDITKIKELKVATTKIGKVEERIGKHKAHSDG
ncbi:MAG: methionine--tRNA ligase [Candidatus Micrarchaeota archaeon]